MTNFEKYKEEILKRTVTGFVLTKDGEITSCGKLEGCEKCKFYHGLYSNCVRDITEWLYQEAE